jgi:HPt (histidine-containing phosphotransfer) domain-containing protein
MTMPQLEQLIQEKQRNDNLLQKSNEALMTYTAELKRLKKSLLQAVGSNETEDVDVMKEKNTNIDTIVKKLLKFKEDNKKLKSILK